MPYGTVSLSQGCFGSRGLLSGGVRALEEKLLCTGPRDISSQHGSDCGCLQPLCLSGIAPEAV